MRAAQQHFELNGIMGIEQIGVRRTYMLAVFAVM